MRTTSDLKPVKNVCLGPQSISEAFKQMAARPDLLGLKPNGLNLRDLRFHHAGEDLGFCPYSNRVVRVTFDCVIPLPITGQLVEVYRLEPHAEAEWIGVKVVNNYEPSFFFFVLRGKEFISLNPAEGSVGDLLRKLAA